MPRFKALVLVWVLVFSTQGFADTPPRADFTVSDLKKVEEKVAKLVETYGPENVLVAFDIDNTLLAVNQPLGSDQWFTWQEKILWSKQGDKSMLSADDFQGLLDNQGLLFSLSSMRPTQKNAPEIVRNIQNMNVPTFLLTSRGFEFMYATLRELYRNGYNFRGERTIAPNTLYGKMSPAYDKATVAGQLGIKDKTTLASLKLDRDSRDVTFKDGVFFTAGQHKGAMMRVLLHKIGLKPKAIVFVDDKVKHTSRLEDAYLGMKDIDVVTFLYLGEQNNVDKFDKQTKKVHQQWQAMWQAFEKGTPKEIKNELAGIFK